MKFNKSIVEEDVEKSAMRSTPRFVIQSKKAVSAIIRDVEETEFLTWELGGRMRFRPIQNKRWLRATATLLLSLFVIILLWMDYIHFKWREEITRDNESEQNQSLLHSQMRFLAMDYEKKEAELMLLRNMSDNTLNVEQDEFYEVIIVALEKLSGGSSYKKPVQRPQPLEAELTVTTMRHLVNYPFARRPAFQILSTRKRTDVDLVIGIPTVKREKESYLLETIQSLISGMTEIERSRALIIVCIGEVTNIDFIANTAMSLNRKFKNYYGDLIEVVSPNRFWYPKWPTIQASLGDSYKRTLWRTKQNLDAIFLMSYAQSKGTYYLMLEDDIVAKDGYVTEMMKFTAERTNANPNWFFINFCKTGGIGKLFRTHDLAVFNSFVQMFYPYMPIDWLIESYLGGRVCGINWHTIQCTGLKHDIRPIYKNALFEHIGLFSSLRGKIQRIKKTLRAGKKLKLFFPHTNPPLANVSSSVKVMDPHTIERAYEGKDYFCGQAPKINDSIVFWFNPPLWLEKFYFGTGHIKRISAILQSGVVEVLPDGSATFVHAEKFDEFGICESYVYNFGPLNALKIRILQDLRHPIIINEIKVEPVKPTAQSLQNYALK